MTNSISRGLLLLAGHCEALLTDKVYEYNEAQLLGEETEYTETDLDDMQNAISFMFECARNQTKGK